VQDELNRLRPPDADGAEERGWALASAAFEAREPAASTGRRRRWVVVALLAAAGTLTALSPAGAEFGDWVSRTVDPPPPAPKPALTSLPASGSVLALAGQDLWLVHSDGARRRVGTYEDATFSPQARFVAATRGSRLAAIDPRGRLRWSLDRAGAVSDPRWAPSGLRIAYRAGHDLRVVYGDGNLDRRLARWVDPVAPAWQPGTSHVLTWVARDGAILTADTDRGGRLWRTPSAQLPRALSWSPDGRRLLVVRGGAVEELDAAGHRIAVSRVAGATAVAWLRDGRTYVIAAGGRIVRRGAGGATVLFAGPGRIDGIAVSPDGRWVLAGWSGAGQWLFVRTDGRGTPRAAPAIARDFTPDAGALAPFPKPLGWR
jgi:dipeptidyl aminopeptidase/acylaminoacyl peptidase